MLFPLTLLATFFASWFITKLARQYAQSRALIDNPNERSSHNVPTPRGGGIAIVVIFLFGVGVMGVAQVLPAAMAWAMGVGGLIVALIGWLDDHSHVAAHWRASVHFIAALWVLFWLPGAFGATGLFDTSNVFLSLATGFLAAIVIVWFTNLYNFMDGTDGLAGSQAVCASLAGGVLLWLSGENGLALILLLLCAASGGFLVWNWPPAKIFMGDVGSGFLGFLFGVFAVAGEYNGGLAFGTWLILLAVFISDATLTLLRRVLNGERWYTAHRSHAYQKLVQAGFSHRQLSIGFVGVNVLLLWPVAWLSCRYPDSLWWYVSTVLLILSVAWVFIQKRFSGNRQIE